MMNWMCNKNQKWMSEHIHTESNYINTYFAFKPIVSIVLASDYCLMFPFLVFKWPLMLQFQLATVSVPLLIDCKTCYLAAPLSPNQGSIHCMLFCSHKHVSTTN